MHYLLSGKHVRIDEEHKVWISTKEGWFPRTTVWHEVSPALLDINTYHLSKIETPYGRLSIADIGIGQVELAHLLGILYLDWNRSREIQLAASSVKGKGIIIDFEHKELSLADSGLVFPFRAFVGIRVAPPTLLLKWPNQSLDVVKLGEFPYSIEELSAKMALPIVDK
jgi:hypothetical protein